MKVENIKFKAKRLDNGEWIEGEISHFENTIWIVPIGHKLFHSGCAEVAPDTICMFTGLKDCNGREVWEGDIIEDDYKTEIIFDQGTFLIHSIDNNYKETFHPLFNYIEWNGNITCKVIGNKFDKNK